jgi:hypothetical protein
MMPMIATTISSSMSVNPRSPPVFDIALIRTVPAQVFLKREVS